MNLSEVNCRTQGADQSRGRRLDSIAYDSIQMLSLRARIVNNRRGQVYSKEVPEMENLEASSSTPVSGLPSESPRPKVFISYSHDSPDHAARVLKLTNRLYEEGIDATIDQYEEEPKEGWPLWTETLILEADFVLLVCTETYLRRLQKKEEVGKGLGATWEAHIIYQLIYEKGMLNEKFLPVLLSGGKAEHIPTPLRSFTHYLVEEEAGYLKLYRKLTGQRRVLRPRLGPLRKLPTEVGAGLKGDEDAPGSEPTEEQRAEAKRFVSRQNNVIWESVTSCAEKIIGRYNRKHRYRFIKALNLISEKYSLYSELSVIMKYPEERSFGLKFKFNEALMEFGYRGIDVSPGFAEVTLNDSHELRFRLKGEEFDLDALLKKIIAPLLIE